MVLLGTCPDGSAMPEVEDANPIDASGKPISDDNPWTTKSGSQPIKIVLPQRTVRVFSFVLKGSLSPTTKVQVTWPDGTSTTETPKKVSMEDYVIILNQPKEVNGSPTLELVDENSGNEPQVTKIAVKECSTGVNRICILVHVTPDVFGWFKPTL